jgi:hypothetical protein
MWCFKDSFKQNTRTKTITILETNYRRLEANRECSRYDGDKISNELIKYAKLLYWPTGCFCFCNYSQVQTLVVSSLWDVEILIWDLKFLQRWKCRCWSSRLQRHVDAVKKHMTLYAHKLKMRYAHMLISRTLQLCARSWRPCPNIQQLTYTNVSEKHTVSSFRAQQPKKTNIVV